MLEFVAETIASPLLAAGRPLGATADGRARPLAGGPLLVLALGSIASTVAGRVGGAAGQPGEGRAIVAVVGGRLLLDFCVWLVVAGLLGLFERAVARDTEPGAAPNPWTVPVAVVGGQRIYILLGVGIARLFGLAYALNIVRVAVWMWMAALLWLLAVERGMDGHRATRLLLLALVLPAALAVAGLALAGLGWIWSPLFPGGITPFPPI